PRVELVGELLQTGAMEREARQYHSHQTGETEPARLPPCGHAVGDGRRRHSASDPGQGRRFRGRAVLRIDEEGRILGPEVGRTAPTTVPLDGGEGRVRVRLHVPVPAPRVEDDALARARRRHAALDVRELLRSARGLRWDEAELDG